MMSGAVPPRSWVIIQVRYSPTGFFRKTIRTPGCSPSKRRAMRVNSCASLCRRHFIGWLEICAANRWRMFHKEKIL